MTPWEPRWAAAAMLAGALVACPGPASAPDAGPTCPQAPASCPTVVPSYQSEISTLIQSQCLVCHSPSGPGTPALTTYEAIHMVDDSMIGQLAACLMPPGDAGALSDADRTTLMTWLVCGAPNN